MVTSKLARPVGVLLASAALCLVLESGSALANTIDRLTATSAQYGVLGYLDVDSAVFNHTSFQYIDNSQLLDLNFVDPISSSVVTAIGPSGQGTFFDSTGILPTVVGGANFTGGTGFANGVWIAGTNLVIVTNDSFNDVTWTTTTFSQGTATPLPAALPLFATGLGALGLLGWRRKRKAVAAA
jgi:hypothetical protein